MKHVKLLKDIWDDGCDGHHPPYYLAYAGEILEVVIERDSGYIAVRHEGAPGAFSIEPHEYEFVEVDHD